MLKSYLISDFNLLEPSVNGIATEQSIMATFINRKACDIIGWIELIFIKNLSLSIVDDNVAVSLPIHEAVHRHFTEISKNYQIFTTLVLL